MSQPFPPTDLQRRQGQTVRDSKSSYKMDYVIVIKNFLNPEVHQNPISGSKVTVILLTGWILPIGEASSGRACACRLVFTAMDCWLKVLEASLFEAGHRKLFSFLLPLCFC